MNAINSRDQRILLSYFKSDMALVCRILRVLLKRLRITLAVAQRIARFLQSTFHHIRSTREFWTVTEVLIRSLIPEVQENINGTVEEDESSEASDRNSQKRTNPSVEGVSEMENDASDTILTSDEDNLMVLFEDSITDSGECSSVCLISDAVDVEFANEELKSKEAATEGKMENNTPDVILTSDDKERGLMILVEDSTTNSGECLSVYSISDTVDVEEVFADEGLKSKVCTTTTC